MQMIITNNPDVAAKYGSHAFCCEGCVIDVFIQVRDAVHKGAKLISHPLSGSIKPNESPYKSVVISKTAGPLDYKSLQVIEDAIAKLYQLSKKNYAYNESILEDFRIIDLDLVNSAYKKE